MIHGNLKSLVAVMATSVALASAAHAGGYSRGSANLDPLMEDGTQVSSSFTVIAPNRGMSTVQPAGAPAAIPASAITPTPALAAAGATGNAGAKFTEAYTVFGATAAMDVVGPTRCAGTFSQPYGANVDYGWTRIMSGVSTTTSSEMSSMEFGLTCSYRAEVGKGNMYVIGGVFHQTIDYTEARGFGFGSVLGGGDIAMDDGSVGYRVGLGYTIPEIALKASLIYRSAVDVGLKGVVRNPAFPGGSVTAFANATTPQSVKLAVQSGVAPGWLVFGSVEWTDWSVLQQVQVFADPGQLAVGAAPIAGVTVDAFFRDGWTVSGGVAHKFNDKFSGLASLTWDRGTSTGRSSYSDTLTVSTGGSYTVNENVSIRGGLAYSFLDSLTEVNTAGHTIGYDKDYSIGGGLSLNIKF
ncbi:outer membrane protein transport protein [Hoeflea sp. YIM 152468]|uniref:outer membrane protein transport protein n=1 Tax=Hoeflea sp. YIM 152468 TaxID=3031759 RepID=UPI0023DBCBA5|nr:outer membrane protein transport protein [Hoeflea sp. YIM 152468]MDF1609874.1 outer membrane protein transport protein [Hoeflea sp. YIM 152468]